MAERSALDIMVKDISQRRADFPVLATTMHGKPLVFLDSGASAQKPQSVIDAMVDVMETGYSNIHRGLYEISQNLTQKCEAVRANIAQFIGAPSDKTIVFTRNTTEAINLVAQSWGRHFLEEGDEIIISEMEHHANIVPWQMLRDQIGIVIKTIPFDERGVLDIDAFKALLTPKTKFVSIVHVSNALGTINPVKEITHIAKDFYPEIKVLVDGSQGVVHGAVDVSDLNCDFYAFTAHKLYGPTGIGVLYGKEGILNAMAPYQGGGDMIERVSFHESVYREAPYKFEAGTPAIIEIIGLGAAVDYVRGVGLDNIAVHEAELLAYGTNALQKIDGLTMHGTSPDKAGIMSFTLDGAHPSDIGMILDQCGVAVRSGHHCCMPLMEKMGLDATVRASIGLYSNKDDIDALISGLTKVKDLFQ